MMSTPSLGFAGGVARSFWFGFKSAPDII